MLDTSNKKHAYLIMAHNNFSQLQTLITLLDDPRNDIYLHVDKKAKMFQPDRLQVNDSKLILVDRIRVNWGGHSQIACELKLLKAAVGEKYAYYHLLSGSDLPLKSQEDIHAFFDRHFPKNFMEFDIKANQTGSFLPRISLYHFFQDAIGRTTGLPAAVLRRLENGSLWIQEHIGARRKQYIPAYKGANWFSITNQLAEYVLSQESLIRKQFYHSVCADEIFLQSIAMDSPYRDTVVNNPLRAIDWTRGEPYTYRADDVEALLRSEDLFGRKFDENIDRTAIEKIVSHLC